MLRRLLLAFVTVGAILGVAEGGLRLVYPPDALLFPSDKPGGLLPVQQASQQARKDGPYGWKVRKNADGLRQPIQVGDRTLAAIGDSWIFGYSVDEGHDLPSVLARKLTEATGVSTAVLNAGCPGGSATLMAERMDEVLSLHPEITGVILGQPHNPRIMADPELRGKVEKKGVFPSLLYRWFRLNLLPYTWDTPPRSNRGNALAAEVAEIQDLVNELRAGGREAWFVYFPQDRVSAMMARFAPEPEWAALSNVPKAGHPLQERVCWAFEDVFHPSEAGVEAIAAAILPTLLHGEDHVAWENTPSCLDVPGAGPGKDGWPAAD